MKIKDTVVAELDHELVVIENFANYVKGEIIADVEKIKELLESEWSAHVVKKPKQPPAEPAAS